MGKVLRAFREESGLTQIKLSELANLDRTYISALERGVKFCSVNVLFKLAAALKVSPTEIIRRVEKQGQGK
ncbi:MAG: helix-turn-helix transcriptional regulator [Bacteroidota bacterium]